MERAGAEFGWAESKMSRIENAKARMPPQNMAALLKLYGVADPEVVTDAESVQISAAGATVFGTAFDRVVAAALSVDDSREMTRNIFGRNGT